MLNRVNILSLFFLLILPVLHVGAEPLDSIKMDLQRKIAAFKYSDQKKQLNALVSTQLILALHKSGTRSNQLKDLYFEHINNLLNDNLLADVSKLLDIYESNYLDSDDRYYYWQFYLLKGIACDFNSQYNAAIKFLKKALVIAKANTAVEYEKTYYYLGLTYSYLKNYDRVIDYFRYIDKNSTDPYRLFDARRRLATVYTIKGNDEKALYFANRAIQSQLLDKNPKKTVVTHENIISLDDYAGALQTRSYILRQKATQNPDSVFLLRQALQDAQTSVKAFELYKRNLFFESDLLEINDIYKYFNFKTIESISRLKRATNNDTLALLALKYAEMDKVSALLRTIQKDIALHHSQIPDTLIHQLNDMYAALGKIEAQRYQAKANFRLHDDRVLSINLKLYDLVTNIDTLEIWLEKNYPDYKTQKYKIELPDLHFIQQLSADKAILEYVVSDEKVYCFLIVDGEITFYDFEYPKDFIQQVTNLRQMISDVEHIKFTLHEQQQFQQISHRLYQLLVAPFEKKLTKKSLLIVPDEALALIPFEVLLPSIDTSQKTVNYAKLDYLINYFDISYSYSLTLLHMQNNLSQSVRENAVFAMAPGYSDFNNNDSSQYFTFRQSHKKLTSLIGAKKEVEKVTRYLKGKTRFNKKATETEFKKNAGKYSVIHLAMHTLVNDDHPMYSKLVFTPNVDPNEDGLMNTYELKNLNLNADLVVLSACKTGYGKVNKGEGIIGLSRGFFQAGCKSLLATLWEVSDNTSVEIIDGFYRGLEKNQTKSHSLSESRRTYIKTAQATLNHPFYWAGYIIIGNDAPIAIAQRKYGYLVFLFLAVIVLSVVFISYKKSREKTGFQSN